MKRAKFGFLLMTLCLMAGCTVTAPGVRIGLPLPGVDINLHAGDNGHARHEDHDDDFCPPGQAMKGRC